MFSSNPSLEIPSSSIHVSPSYFDHYHDHDHDHNHNHNHNNINIHGVYFMPQEHNSNPVHVSADCFLNSFKTTVPPPSPPLPVATANTQDLISQQQLHEGSVLQYSDDYDDLLESIVYPCKKKPVNSKKDGHSKIYTAQGPRDRRVRLSIDIARKFFELQSLLGFDKASKTLDWLFTKSKVAIRELVEQTKHSSSSIVTTGICESAFLDDDSTTEGQKKAEFKFVNGKMKKMAQKHKSGHHVDLAREQSRAEARARARERTKEKWRIQEQQYELKKFPDECSYHAVSSSNLKLQSSFWGQIESENVYNEPMVEKRLFRSDSGFEPVSESGN